MRAMLLLENVTSDETLIKTLLARCATFQLRGQVEFHDINDSTVSMLDMHSKFN